MAANLLLFAAFVVSMLLMSFNYKKRKKIIFFGGSLIAQGAEPVGFISRIRSFLKKAGLDDKYDLFPVPFKEENVEEIVARIPAEVLGKAPDLVIVYFGFEDFNGIEAGAMTDFENSYKSIIDKLVISELELVICLPLPLQEVNDLKVSNRLLQPVEVVRQLANNYNLRVVDLFKLSMAYQILDTDNLKTSVFRPAEIQLNDQGHQLVAEQLWKVIRQVYNIHA